jgi:acyl-CoA thioester hydrolase
MFSHDIVISVRYAETDRMGIVHHSNYPIWFEIGRTEISKKIGIPYTEIEEIGLMWPLINLSCAYKSPAAYDDDVIIRTFVKEVTNTRISFGYEAILKKNEKLLCIGATEHVWADKNFKPVNGKKVFPHVFEIYRKHSLNGAIE